MTKNEDGTYKYLVIPEKYGCVYNKLLIKMSDFGVALLKDCGATCRGHNKQIMNCWNMFQAACCAHELGEIKKADLLIEYIIGTFKFDCTIIPVPTISEFKLNVTDVKGKQTITIETAEFVITDIEVVKPDSLKIINKADDKPIFINQDINSPVTFETPLSIEVTPGNTYTWYATIEDINGKIHGSNEYSIEVTAIDKPVITNLILNVANNIIGAQTVKLQRATFNVVNKHSIKDNSLRLVYLNDNIDIFAGENAVSPIAFEQYSLDLAVNTSYRFQLEFEDIDGNKHSSNIYTITCTAIPAPSISSFSLNIGTTIVGAQTVTVNRATFTISNKTSAKENSLKIKLLNNDSVVATGLSLTSPASFTDYGVDMTVGETYRFQAIIEDIDGIEYKSNVYSVSCVAAPKSSTMYYGLTTVNGAAGAVAFKSKQASELMTMPKTEKVITGNNNVTFTLNQTENVHWLLIPTDTLELIRGEYGDILITTLWDKTTQSGAYKQPFDAGTYDGVKYTMFFLYSPMTFKEEIRITVKNI